MEELNRGLEKRAVTDPRTETMDSDNSIVVS